MRTLEPPEPRSKPPVGLGPFLADADARLNAYIEALHGAAPAGFVPSDFACVERALRGLRDSGLAPGDEFCEWGSGFGVVTCLAAMLGYNAVGIEFHPELVEHAESLAADHDIDVRFAEGSFLPDEHQALADEASGEAAWLLEGGPDGHDALDADPGDFDVVFAYPWPGQERTLEKLFHRVAEVDAVLVTYRGVEGVIIQQKTPPKPGNRHRRR